MWKRNKFKKKHAQGYTKITEIYATDANRSVILASKCSWRELNDSYLSGRNLVVNTLVDIHDMFPICIVFHATIYNYY